jgi:hypothetical protein
MTEPTDDTLRAWLLGQLAPAEAQALEQRLIEDEDFAARLRAVENDLLDDLAHGALAGDERARAAAYFAATPDDRARLRIARALAAVAADAVPSRANAHAREPARVHAMRRRRRWSAAALALAGVAAIAVIGLRFYPNPAVPVAFTITLTDGQQRGASSIEIAIPEAARELRLQAEVEGEPGAGAHYLLSIDDTFAASGLPVHATGAYRFVETTVPAAALAAGAHRVRVVAEAGATGEASWTLTTRNE